MCDNSFFVADSVAADQVDDVAGSSVAVELEPELAEASATATLASVSNSKVLATPAVRRIAGENQVEISPHKRCSV